MKPSARSWACTETCEHREFLVFWEGLPATISEPTSPNFSAWEPRFEWHKISQYLCHFSYGRCGRFSPFSPGATTRSAKPWPPSPPSKTIRVKRHAKRVRRDLQRRKGCRTRGGRWHGVTACYNGCVVVLREVGGPLPFVLDVHAKDPVIERWLIFEAWN